MTELTEQGHAGGFILSEANGARSRQNITIAAGQNLKAGTVLGKNTTSGKFVQLDLGATTGEQTAAGILYADVNATNGEAEGVAIDCDAEVNGHELIWPDDADTGEQATAINQLKSLGIKVRL